MAQNLFNKCRLRLGLPVYSIYVDPDIVMEAMALMVLEPVRGPMQDFESASLADTAVNEQREDKETGDCFLILIARE